MLTVLISKKSIRLYVILNIFKFNDMMTFLGFSPPPKKEVKKLLKNFFLPLEDIIKLDIYFGYIPFRVSYLSFKVFLSNDTFFIKLSLFLHS